MLAAIHKDLAVAVNVAFKQDIGVIPALNNAPWIRRQPGHARGQAICLRIVLRWTLLGQLQCPWLDRKLLAFLECIADVIREIAIGAPDSGEVRFAVRHSWGRAGGNLRGGSSVFRRAAGWIGGGLPFRRTCRQQQSRSHCRDGHVSEEVVHWLGPPSPDVPAKTFLPSAKVTVLALAMFDPSFAMDPVTVTTSPTFKECLVQPCRIRPLGLASSKFQFVTLPLSSFTST